MKKNKKGRSVKNMSLGFKGKTYAFLYSYAKFPIHGKPNVKANLVRSTK